jgi:glycine cleavage system H protein
MMKIPTDLKYTKTDEWLKVDGKIISIGITDYAQNHLSDLVFCGLKAEMNQSLAKGDLIVEIDSVKASAEVTSPISGKVIETNPSLASSPEVINTDPYGNGWFYKIEVFDPADLDTLMSSVDYEKYCETRGD